MPHHIKPMLATLAKEPFDDKNWVFEIKWDGFRAIAEIKNGTPEIYSRNLLSFNDRFKPIVKSLSRIKKNVILDGEIVVIDKSGKSFFQLIQNYQNTGQGNLVYYVFDILYYDRSDLKNLPLMERKKILSEVLPEIKNIRYSEHIDQYGKKFYNLAKKMGLEGILAKRRDGIYLPGRRTSEWLKIKTHLQQEAVIAGFTEPRGSRAKFGALVLGVYERGRLKYIGHTGGGFNDQSLRHVYDKLKRLVTKTSAFENPPKTNAPVTWVRPKLVAEINFSEWTADGHMRQPIFLGLRPDKDPKEVKKEIPK